MDEVNQQSVVSNQTPAEKEQKPHILKSFSKNERKNSFFILISSLIIVGLGILTGWVLSGKSGQGLRSGEQDSVAEISKTENEAGVEDESIFPHEAEGKLIEGGLEAEGTHHLERPGGASQTVYLTSTVIDLQSFVDKKVKVWGQTISGQKTGWLMDVGKIKVIE